MKKTASVLIAVILMALALSGCAEHETHEKGYTFTDDLSRTVTVTEHKRVAALLGSFADVWILSGGEVCATADDAWEDFKLELSEDCINLGQTKQLSLEKLLKADADLVLASTATKQHIEWREILEASGITVAYFDVASFDDYLKMLKICTDINDRHDLYEKNGLAIKEKIDETIENGRKRTEQDGRQSVLFLRASSSYIRAKGNDGTILGEMLIDLGCDNIADADSSLTENLSIESILHSNPDKIFIVQSGDDMEGSKRAVENMFSENPMWLQLDAVKNEKVYYLDKMLYNLKPNSNWSTAYEELEKILSE